MKVFGKSGDKGINFRDRERLVKRKGFDTGDEKDEFRLQDQD